MTAIEFDNLFRQHCLNTTEVAGRLGIESCDLVRYRAGSLSIPKVVEYAVLWIIHAETQAAFMAGN